MTTLPGQVRTVAVQVRYFAGARAAAGVPEETVRVSRTGGTVTAADVIAAALDRHDENLAKVLPACSFLLDGVAVRDRGIQVADDATLDVLPPFAGG
ncbi:MoaD/ThiS family protein [Saccharopolyspora phatthalungensis]|uniref:Molybdopterin converting factor small subunit n=1 Tax=Saccharopolyspora phatthalungensis TaxID=664693 RepID=A0A840Q1E6_9PSEU|nr:MoaD/ThiS family protein [Saccharopolyspora phatthalungensis]MBB5153827.1 molybdopterin converting factor small subunit [Saccharopolyspora phatthalungensis]